MNDKRLIFEACVNTRTIRTSRHAEAEADLLFIINEGTHQLELRCRAWRQEQHEA